MTVVSVMDKPGTTVSAVSPHKLAHVVFKTSRYRELIAWYKTVLGAGTAFSNDFLTFLSYDDEHHRVAIINMPGLEAAPDKCHGLHHVAFTYANFDALLTNYERLRDLGILPVFVINHGPTSSMYYADPDGNQIELQIDNYDTIEEATEFFYSKAFADNAVGVEFDPEDMLRRFRMGETEQALKIRPESGPRGLADIKLR
jgi:catechol-2,3-dioxygenase